MQHFFLSMFDLYSVICEASGSSSLTVEIPVSITPIIKCDLKQND